MRKVIVLLNVYDTESLDYLKINLPVIKENLVLISSSELVDEVNVSITFNDYYDYVEDDISNIMYELYNDVCKDSDGRIIIDTCFTKDSTVTINEKDNRIFYSIIDDNTDIKTKQNNYRVKVGQNSPKNYFVGSILKRAKK